MCLTLFKGSVAGKIRGIAQVATKSIQGRFGKQDFVDVPEKDVYRCPAGEQLTYRFTAEEHGKTRYAAIGRRRV
jgi:hypothetical protein